MGMPGSKTALEEVMCRVLGPLLLDGTVAKIADNLYCGGNTPQELFCPQEFVCPQDYHQPQDHYYSRLDLVCWFSLCQSPPLKHPCHVP